MKKVEAIIQPYKLYEVKLALHGVGVGGITVTEVRSHGRQMEHIETDGGQEYKTDLGPKVKLEMVVPDSTLKQVVETLCAAARSSKIGDGKIFASSTDQPVHIRNGETGNAAL